MVAGLPAPFCRKSATLVCSQPGRETDKETDRESTEKDWPQLILIMAN